MIPEDYLESATFIQSYPSRNNQIEAVNLDEYAQSEIFTFNKSFTDISNGDIAATQGFDLGPRRQGLYIVIPITVIYVIIFITGLIGNICTCVVITKNRYMHTATNFYLFNLAISDLLLLLVGLPQETFQYWYEYPWIFGEECCVARVMAAETSTYASILTITAFTVERYIAIVHPMRAQGVSSLPRAVKIIILIWVVSSVCSVPTFIQFGIVYRVYLNGTPVAESAICGVKQDASLPYSFELSTILFFFVPMMVITVLYVLIGIAVRRSTTLSRSGSDSSSSHAHERETGTELRSQQQIKARRAVLKMLVAVVVAFFICWAPFHMQRLVYSFYNDTENWTVWFKTITHVFFYVSGILYYVSSVINPILYNVMSLKFRRAFNNTIFSPCHADNSRKRSTVIAYKFCRGHVEMDSDGSHHRLQQKDSPPGAKCNGVHNRADSHSHNSGKVGSGGQEGGGGVGGSQMELRSFSSISDTKMEIKTRHSLTPRTAYNNIQYETRPYHSFA